MYTVVDNKTGLAVESTFDGFRNIVGSWLVQRDLKTIDLIKFIHMICDQCPTALEAKGIERLLNISIIPA